MSYNHSGLLNGLAKLSTSLVGVPLQDHNTILTFTVFSGSQTTDDWGNVVLGTQTIVTLLAKLAEVKSYVEQNPGVDRTKLYYKGYLINPTTYTTPLPKKISAQMLYEGTWRVGEFYPITTFDNSLNERVAVSTSLGQSISGYFQITEGN